MNHCFDPSAAARRVRRAVAAGCMLATMLGGFAGCRSYERRPLDLEAIHEGWQARSPADETARAFMARLARAEGREPADFNLSDGLALVEGEPVALVFNRELRVARLEADVTRATADYAGLWNDPVAGVDIERIVSGVAEPWVIAGTVGLTIPISGRLGVEKARAGASYSAELHRLAAKEWATRAVVRELWVEWSAQLHRARMAAELVERLRVVADVAQAQQRAGAMSRIDARLFRVEVAAREAELIVSRARAAELELRVRDTVGLAPEAPVRLIETVAFAGRGSDTGWTLALLQAGNPELDAARSDYEVAEQSLHLEVRKQYPDLTIGPGFGRDQGDDRLLLGVSLPIPLWNRNQQGVAEAEARREAARASYENTYERLASQLAIGRARLEAARATTRFIETQLVPLADEQDAEVRRVAELGRVDPLLLLAAIKAQHDAKVQLVDARAAEAVGAIRLDELIGPPSAHQPGEASPPAAGAAVPTHSSPHAPGGRP